MSFMHPCLRSCVYDDNLINMMNSTFYAASDAITVSHMRSDL